MSRIRGGIRELASGRFQVRFTDPRGTGKTVTAGMTFETRADAQYWLTDQRRRYELDPENWLPPAEQRERDEQLREARRLTVEDLFDHYLAHKEISLRESTIQAYSRAFNGRVRKVKGEAGQLRSVFLCDLRTEHVATWWEAVAREFPNSPSNRTAYTHLRAAGHWAVERGLLEKNPILLSKSTLGMNQKKQHSIKDKDDLLTVAEAQAVIDNAPTGLRLAFVLTLLHGMRIGEVLALERGDIQCKNDGVYVAITKQVQRIQEDSHSKMILLPPKTIAGYRTVPVIPACEKYVSDHLAQMSSKTKTALLFPGRGGGYRMDTSVRELMQRAAKKAGIGRRIRPHMGRNLIITRLLETGAAPAEVGAITGQSDLKVITEVYAGVRKERPRELMNMMGFA